MKQKVSETANGVQIENTLSMALQKQYPKRRKLYLVLIAFTGIIGSIFSFLTMFSPVYSPPVLMTAMVIIFLFFSCFASRPEHSLLPILGVVLIYCALFFWHRECIASGLMYLTNDVCQAIYMTDWEYFMTDTAYSEIRSVTCVLCFLVFPIIWMICYAVLRYQNFFLSLLVTFPFIEIGLFFGIVPNHFFAAALTAFWFAMAAVQMASSGVTQSGGKTGFLRRKNAFFPVSGMRFMLSEYTGITILLLILLLFGGAEFLLKKAGYTRPEEIKNIRADFQNYVASLRLTDHPILDDYGNIVSQPEDTENIPLGNTDQKVYENIPVTSIAFSENPETRIYLKYRTGHNYTGTNWTGMPEEIYQKEIFTLFDTLDYYPPEFLYTTVSESNPVQMSLYHTTGILSQCIPYGFQKNENILCQRDDSILTSTGTYTIQGKTDYESKLADADTVTSVQLQELLQSCDTKDMQLLSGLLAGKEERSVWIADTSELMMAFYGGGTFTSRSAEAGILCGSFYDDFVYEVYTALPDTPSMLAVQTEYADILRDFDAQTASPAEMIKKLQEIRNKICSEATYTLSPGKTPSNMDHTAYFLLQNHQGYCEHYATAGTVLARMAGIPARYCEGYMIDCTNENALTESETEEGNIIYTSEILDSNAHAWTEIYLSGIGWIPFEFTFSYFASSSVPETTSSETSEPVPETNPSTTSATTLATEPVTDAPIQEKTEIPTKLFLLIILLTAAAFCCILILIFRIARLSAIRKRERQCNQNDKKAASFCAYQYLTELLAECKVHTKGRTIGELVEEAEHCCAQYMNPAYSLSAAVQIGAKLRYSPHPMTNSELHYLNRTAQALAEGMYQQAGFFRKFYFKWLKHYL